MVIAILCTMYVDGVLVIDHIYYVLYVGSIYRCTNQAEVWKI